MSEAALELLRRAEAHLAAKEPDEARTLLERRRSRVGAVESQIKSPAPVAGSIVEGDTVERPVPTPPVVE